MGNAQGFESGFATGQKNPLLGTELSQRVYALLAAKFGYETWIQYADIGNVLAAEGIDRRPYGFKKLNDFIEAVIDALDGAVESRFVMLDERHSARQALIHRVDGLADASGAGRREAVAYPSATDAGEPADHACVAPALDYQGVAAEAKNTPEYVSGRASESVLNALSPVFRENAFFPVNSKSYLAPLAPAGADLDALVAAAWSAALAVGAIRTYDGKLIFPLPLDRSDGTSFVELNLAPNDRTPEVTPWFVQYVDAGPRKAVSRGQSPSRALTEFAYLGHWETFLEELADLALPENWEFKEDAAAVSDLSGQHRYPILRSYITNTFYRLQREGKICVSADQTFAALNTGLVTKRYDDIYMCLEPNAASERSPWRFAGFCTRGVGRLGKRLVNLFNPLPPTASFFDRKEDLLFDVDRELIVNYEHVILDNMGRLPIDFLKEGFRTDDHALGLLDELPGLDIERRERVLDELRGLLEQDNVAFMYLRVRLNDAIDRARRRVRWNYKTAIPMYYPRANTMSLLLPICLMDPSVADAALVVELMESGNYQGQTVLTMRMAYQDARLVCRPDSDWLTTNARCSCED